MSDQKYTDDDLRRVAGIVKEDFYNKLDALFENFDIIIDKKLEPLKQLQADVSELKTDVRVVISVVTDISRKANAHGRRIQQLEKQCSHA